MIFPSGRAVAIIDIKDDTSAYNLPGGAEAQVAVYTPFAHHFAIIRRILLRMRSWQNFVFLEGHGGGGGGEVVIRLGFGLEVLVGGRQWLQIKAFRYPALNR